jgi:hypothetical protein
MAEIITSLSQTPLPIPPIPGDISSLVSKDTIKNLKSSINPKSFGSQIKNIDTQKIISTVAQSKISQLYQEKAFLIQKEIKLDIDHQKNLLLLEQKKTPQVQIVNGETKEIPAKLTEEEYQSALIIENGGTLPNGQQVKGNYPEEKENIQKQKEEIQKSIDDILKDPFKEQKEKEKAFKESLKKSKKLTKEERKKARKEKSKAVLKNAAKTIVPVITLLLTNKIAEIIKQNNFIKKLVDSTNKIIKDANLSNDPVKLQNAKLARDNAVRIITSNENKIKNIQREIQKISIYINIFSIVVSIISSIPIPTSVPPGVGIPVSLIMRLVRLLERANRIISSLSAYLPIILVSLDKVISILNDYKSQLLNINGIIDTTAIESRNNNILTSPSGPKSFEKYKGYEFAIKEENNPKFNVRGFKRKYAVAIKSGIERFRSDYSFTLDPNDLIEQLKLLIDNNQQSLSTIQTNILPVSSNEQNPKILQRSQKTIQSEIDFLNKQQKNIS